MLRKHVPDLDNLESPLISADPFGSMLGTMPGSAIAEKIFNDPESWGGAEAEHDVETTKYAMAWLEEELEKYRVIGDKLGLSTPIERLDRGLSGMFRMGPSPVSSSPPSTSSFDKHDAVPKDRHLPPTLDLPERAPSVVVSPVGVPSASPTWSILELYGLHPETPRSNSARASLFSPYPPTPTMPIPPVFQPPTHRKTSSRSSISWTSTASPLGTPTPLPMPSINILPPTSETPALIRRLPVIPDPSNIAPPRSLTPQPLHSQAPERTPRNAGLLPPLPTFYEQYLLSTSPNAALLHSGITRSPPAGPRPRSGCTTPAKQRENSRHSPSASPYFAISAAPAPPRLPKALGSSEPAQLRY